MHERETPAWDVEPALEWLLNESNSINDTDMLIQALGQKLLDLRAPVWRIRLSTRMLHPLVAAVTSIWERDSGETRTATSRHGIEGRPAYLGSPLQVIDQTKQPFRCNLTDLEETAHSSLQDLHERGGTDYYGRPMPFRNGSRGVLVFVTDCSSGFSNSDIAKLDRVFSVIALIAEIISTGHSSISIAEAYLGTRTARRVLDGQITRGHFDTIHAAIFVSDIRGWTDLTNRLEPHDALSLVNGYYEKVASSIERYDGEILKLMGDGVLAIFLIEDAHADPALACEHALAAAKQCVADIQSSQQVEQLEIGIGLNFGEVLYGNVGSKDRIDFTVLGQAVNVAARIEGCCARLGRSILMTSEFADAIKEPTQKVSSERLKGCEARVDVLTISQS